MVTEPYNPSDPEFLLSRRIDEPLSEQEQGQVRAFEASSIDAPQVDQHLKAVASLVAHWAGNSIEVDADSYVEGVLGRIADSHAHEFGKVDRALRQWNDGGVNVDAADFLDAVRQRVESETETGEMRPWMLRVRRPLAAAAVVAVAVLAAMWFQDSNRSFVEVATVRVAKVEFGEMWDHSSVSRVVMFDRTVVVNAQRNSDRDAVSISVIGSGFGENSQNELPPL